MNFTSSKGVNCLAQFKHRLDISDGLLYYYPYRSVLSIPVGAARRLEQQHFRQEAGKSAQNSDPSSGNTQEVSKMRLIPLPLPQFIRDS